MFLCNSLGVFILISIAAFHVIGVDAEKNSEKIVFEE